MLEIEEKERLHRRIRSRDRRIEHLQSREDEVRVALEEENVKLRAEVERSQRYVNETPTMAAVRQRDELRVEMDFYATESAKLQAERDELRVELREAEEGMAEWAQSVQHLRVELFDKVKPALAIAVKVLDEIKRTAGSTASNLADEALTEIRKPTGGAPCKGVDAQRYRQADINTILGDQCDHNVVDNGDGFGRCTKCGDNTFPWEDDALHPDGPFGGQEQMVSIIHNQQCQLHDKSQRIDDLEVLLHRWLTTCDDGSCLCGSDDSGYLCPKHATLKVLKETKP